MIDMHSKYDNMHTNEMFYALICINNHIIECVNCILSVYLYGISSDATLWKKLRGLFF